ncbi:hypothetical protein PGB34_04910 [Xenophilus arseniciresistens]|uniref:Glutaconyl-CoA decarboxylase subunit gamma n=1 Tax=Xenophilus arseniciresistens TaxID=1283306 RepID=A0AAE3N5N0_9BURK|nr:hypothetical protein [Xenophilus arseniciresistens]MDA7415696.1 hypothetical protein [Xenophilus arseniciresistens]
MNKLYALMSVAVLVAACSSESAPVAPAPAPAPAASAPAPAAPAPAPAPEPAASAPAAAPTASTDLPQECQDYLNKVSACVSKQSGAAADAMKASMEQTRSAWAAYGADKAQLGAACKTASDNFAAQATAMKC